MVSAFFSYTLVFSVYYNISQCGVMLKRNIVFRWSVLHIAEYVRLNFNCTYFQLYYLYDCYN